MADYVIRKRSGFTFNIEGDGKLYTIPPLNMLGADDLKLFKSLTENTDDFESQINKAKSFVLKYAPELESAGIGDIDYVYVFNAYSESQIKVNGISGVGEY